MAAGTGTRGQAHLVAEAPGPWERRHGHQHVQERQAATPAVLTAHAHQGPHTQQQVLAVAELRTEWAPVSLGGHAGH